MIAPNNHTKSQPLRLIRRLDGHVNKARSKMLRTLEELFRRLEKSLVESVGRVAHIPVPSSTSRSIINANTEIFHDFSCECCIPRIIAILAPVLSSRRRATPQRCKSYDASIVKHNLPSSSAFHFPSGISAETESPCELNARGETRKANVDIS
ncbi:hypothetical protein A0H81_10552 [Grifola frondosa]|uniref:Uncharacterized protein n=1 Tax=Grifola frondosa TaxID=5627 RepID=A0A1C7LXW9_GRIFR|nr:hypothetical protein A0H81_10552 [Grifola frondosa]